MEIFGSDYNTRIEASSGEDAGPQGTELCGPAFSSIGKTDGILTKNTAAAKGGQQTMRIKKSKTVKKNAGNGIICGTTDNMQEASRELDRELHNMHDMHVVWTSAGFWALPRK